jgi:hypothetical protein
MFWNPRHVHLLSNVILKAQTPRFCLLD